MHEPWLQLRASAPRRTVQIAAALGSGICALGGYYPPYDGYQLRLLVGALAALAAVVVVWRALSRPTCASALTHTTLTGVVFGVITPLLPAVIITWQHPSDLGAALALSVAFGLPTGLIYTIPLAVLVASCWSHVDTSKPTWAGAQRVARVAGAWVAVGTLAALWPTLACAPPHLQGWGSWALASFECALALSAAAFALTAHLRLRRMERWLDRVVAGGEPGFHARVRQSDDIDLPVARGGEHVIERLPPDDGTAYRDNASGTPLCIG